MDAFISSSFLAKKLRRIWNMTVQDKRLRAAVISYFIPCIWITLCERFIYMYEEDPFYLARLVRFLGCLLAAYMFSDPENYKYSLQSFLLGAVSGLSIHFALKASSPWHQSFTIYTFVIASFHFTEFFVTGLSNPDNLKPDSFLLNHSKTYWLAAAASWLEFLVERYFFPDFYSRKVTLIGIAFCALGEILRKLAMCHAASGFTHQIAVRKHKQHRLITSGVYSFCRHPGYLGWFIWSVGTQIILCNPICLLIYARVTYLFFYDRIYEEERYLVEFFGQRYILYQQSVCSGIPGILGFTSTS